MLVFLAVSAGAQSVPNGDFENGTIAGWTVTDGPGNAGQPFVSEQQPVWVMEVERGSGRAVICSSAFVVTRQVVAAQMVNLDNRDGASAWWVEPVAGVALPLETEHPDDAGQGWSDHELSVANACAQEVVLCVEPERQETLYYDDFVLEGAPCASYTDGDGDGYCVVGQDLDADGSCADADEFAGVSDCNDGSSSVHPGGAEACNGIDDDCDGLVDETFDLDGDGWFCDDCNDVDPDVNPGMPEVCNAIDDDCNEGVDEGFDVDVDGFTCDDCDDSVASTHPGAVEQCNGLDDDCNDSIDDNVQISVWWPDVDGDGYGDPDGTSTEGCAAEPGTVADATDCDDGDPGVHPGAADPPLDGVDANCDGEDGTATDPVDTGEPVDPGDPGERPIEEIPPEGEAVGCGCGHGARGGWMVGLLILVHRARRRSEGGARGDLVNAEFRRGIRRVSQRSLSGEGCRPDTDAGAGRKDPIPHTTFSARLCESLCAPLRRPDPRDVSPRDVLSVTFRPVTSRR